MSDVQLIAAARKGDRRAMAALYTAHSGRVYSVVRRMVGDDHLAEDVSQDAWVRAFEKLHSFRGESSFGTWMHRLAVNSALNRLRRQSKRPNVEAAADKQSGPPPTDDTVLNQKLLSQALDQLSPGYRTVLVLHDVQGLTHDEIADRMGVAVGTSKSQLHKARARMRDLLSPGQGINEAGSHA